MSAPPPKFRQVAVRLFRAGILAATILALRFLGGSAAPDETVALEDARRLYPDAIALRTGDNLTTVLGEEDSVLGFVVKTLPRSQKVIGYSGPSDLLLSLDSEGRVGKATLLWSGDTMEHVAVVREHPEFFDAFNGWTLSGENDVSAIDAVSGATLTSLAMIESVAVRLGGERPSLKFPNPVRLADVQRLFPDAATIQTTDSPATPLIVRDADGAVVGGLLRSAPVADAITGYQGPSDALIGLGPDGAVQGITLGETFDNQRYADYVRHDDYFTERHRGKSLEDLANLDVDQVWSDGVSGATMTSGAVMEAAIKRAAHHLSPTESTATATAYPIIRLRDGITAMAILLGCIVAYTRLRANRFTRYGLYLYLVLALGLWAGDMVSLAVVGGWANGAVPWKSAPGLVALVAAALVLPWATGKPVYCQQLCPHGAAQALLYRLIPGRLRVPARLHRMLKLLPTLILAGGIAIAASGIGVSLSNLEAFDAWIFGVGGLATIIIAVVGLAVSMFIPQAYCKYGCPTGAILEYARTRKNDAALTKRDAIAVALLLMTIVLSVAS